MTHATEAEIRANSSSPLGSAPERRQATVETSRLSTTLAQKTTICTRCVMDTSDPSIEFDEQGVCNHCHMYDHLVQRFVHSGDAGREQLARVVADIKRDGAGKRYDCI